MLSCPHHIHFPNESHKIKIWVANILPPPDDLSLPIVKLLSHPSYQSYQSRIASLSLFSEVYIKYLPPAWGAPIPSSSASSEDGTRIDSKEKKEWKRRIKMYSTLTFLPFFSVPISHHCCSSFALEPFFFHPFGAVGPVLEAFGFQRIIFGSGLLRSSSQTDSRAADWYELARESFAELGVEQEAIDAVFFENAKKVYSSV